MQELAAQGVAFVKVWVDDRGGSVEKLTPPLYRAAIDEAHRHDLAVIAHVFYHQDASELVSAGVDGFAHLVRDREMDDDLVAAIVERDVFVMPNLGISERGRHAEPPPWLAEPLLAETLAPARARTRHRVVRRPGSRGGGTGRADVRADGAQPREAARGGSGAGPRLGLGRAGSLLRLLGAPRAGVDGRGGAEPDGSDCHRDQPLGGSARTPPTRDG